MTDILLKIEALITPLLEGSDMFVVAVKMKPTNNLKVFLDADTGLSIGKISQINKKLYALIEESHLFPEGDFSLEVSSPGVDEPLTSIRQYKKNIGRTVAIVFNEEVPEKIGVLKEVLEDSLLIESKINKKKETETVVIPFSAIKTITVQIVF